MNRHTGCIKDTKDDDYIYEDFQRATPQNITYDTTPYLPPVMNQKEGSCTMMAVSASIAAQRKKILGDSDAPSVQYGYYFQRAMDNNQHMDTGGSIRGACKAVKKFGLVPNVMYPYVYYDYNDTPMLHLVLEGAKRKISGYYRITTYEGIIDALKRGCPVCFNTDIWAWRIGPDGKVTNAHEWEKFKSTNHALDIVTYYPSMKFDIDRPAFKIRNSWGENEGDKGYYYVPSEILFERGTIDVWCPVVTFKELDEPNNSYEEITGQVDTPVEDSRFRYVAFVGAWKNQASCDDMVTELQGAGFPALKKYLQVFK